jgi:general secretion pathway protein D
MPASIPHEFGPLRSGVGRRICARGRLLFLTVLAALPPAGCEANWWGAFGPAERRLADPALPAPQPYVRVIRGREVNDLSNLPALASAGGDVAPTPQAGPLDETRLDEVSFGGVPLSNAAVMLTKMTGVNIVASAEVGAKPIHVYLKDVTARSAIEAICRLHDLWYREDAEMVRLLTREEYGRELVIKSDQQTHLYYLKNASAPAVADTIASLMPDQVRYFRAGDDTSFGHVGTDGDDPMSNTRSAGGSTASTTGGRYDAGMYSEGRTGAVSRTNYAYSASDVATNYQKGLASGKVEELTRGTEARRTGEVSAQAVAEKTGAVLPVTVSVFLRNNCIAVRTVHRSAQDEIGKIIQALDTPTRQVLLEVKVLNATLGDGFESVFGMTYDKGGFSAKWLDGADIDGATLSFSYLDSHISATLKLLKDDNRLHAVATPMVLCANNAPAEFFSGLTRMITTNYDYETRYGENNQAVDIVRPVVEERNIGTDVRIKPSINTDGTVTLRFHLDISSVNTDGANIYQVNSEGAVVALPIDTVDNHTTENIVVARHGQAVVMGGLITESVSRLHQRLPGLGDIPGLGLFMGKKVDKTTRTETIIVIIPHIIATPDQGPAVSRPVLENNSGHPLRSGDYKGLTRWNPQTLRLEESQFPREKTEMEGGDVPTPLVPEKKRSQPRTEKERKQ